MNQFTTDQLIEELARRLMIAGVASCDCLTKTPDPDYHTLTCRYARTARAGVDLTNIKRQIAGMIV